MNSAPRREVQSKHLFMRTEDDHMQEKKKILNLYAEMDGPLGVVKINREHRMNTLSPTLVEDITRGVNSVCQDHYSHVIYLGTGKGLHFCNGSDFRTLAHMQRENAKDRI
jgi:enoyl-CoA hydratase/carnithine racemase